MTVVREALDVRGLKAMAIWVRMVLAARRLLSGLPVTDDAAFNELDRLPCACATTRFSCLACC